MVKPRTNMQFNNYSVFMLLSLPTILFVLFEWVKQVFSKRKVEDTQFSYDFMKHVFYEDKDVACLICPVREFVSNMPLHRDQLWMLYGNEFEGISDCFESGGRIIGTFPVAMNVDRTNARLIAKIPEFAACIRAVNQDENFNPHVMVKVYFTHNS